MASQSLFDTLAGGFGHGVDRPALESFVANSQSINGLRTAQTEEAMNNAQTQQEEQAARAKLEATIGGTLGADGNPIFTPSQAHMAAQSFIAQHGGKVSDGINALVDMQKAHNTMMLSDKNNLNTPAATAAIAGNTNKAPETALVPDEYSVPAGMAPPVVHQTPLGAAKTGAQNAVAGLNNVKADAGGFAPRMGGTTPEQGAALTKAVNEGRLDPMRVNSRSAPILAQMEMNNPGMNFNGMHADAVLQSNAGFQQKAISMDAMPTILSHMTSLGKKLNGGTGYSDVKTVGAMQQWMNGQLNDPDYTEYMTVRNDALMKLASVMRGVGMSDQAHMAEIQAAAPTLSPLALDGWLKGQLSTMEPLLKRTQAVEHLGGDRITNPAVKDAAPTGAPLKFDTEEHAAAANLSPGTKIVVGGVPGTWH